MLMYCDLLPKGSKIEQQTGLSTARDFKVPTLKIWLLSNYLFLTFILLATYSVADQARKLEHETVNSKITYLKKFGFKTKFCQLFFIFMFKNRRSWLFFRILEEFKGHLFLLTEKVDICQRSHKNSSKITVRKNQFRNKPINRLKNLHYLGVA